MDRCPHCESAIDCDAAWRNTDYQSVFRYVCGECDGVVEITVSMCPEFAVDFPHCEKCGKVTDGTRHYCESCQRELDALSIHIQQRFANSER